MKKFLLFIVLNIQVVLHAQHEGYYYNPFGKQSLILSLKYLMFDTLVEDNSSEKVIFVAPITQVNDSFVSFEVKDIPRLHAYTAYLPQIPKDHFLLLMNLDLVNELRFSFPEPFKQQAMFYFRDFFSGNATTSFILPKKDKDFILLQLHKALLDQDKIEYVTHSIHLEPQENILFLYRNPMIPKKFDKFLPGQPLTLDSSIFKLNLTFFQNKVTLSAENLIDLEENMKTILETQSHKPLFYKLHKRINQYRYTLDGRLHLKSVVDSFYNFPEFELDQPEDTSGFNSLSFKLKPLIEKGLIQSFYPIFKLKVDENINFTKFDSLVRAKIIESDFRVLESNEKNQTIALNFGKTGRILMLKLFPKGEIKTYVQFPYHDRQINTSELIISIFKEFLEFNP
ncbi:MAG: hypothetical protein MUE53_01345 [Chitinophagales bacterium]|nr:hypothetical protein [Chitinophagales bacterium]